MTPNEAHQAAQAQTETAVDVLMQWVSETQKSLQNEKLDATARARNGELILASVQWLSFRQESLRKVALEAELKQQREARDRR